MRNCCPANQFSGCCEGIECQSHARKLERFTKALDMRGVFLPGTCTLLAIIAFFAVSTAVGLTIIQLREDARQYQISRV